MMAEAPHEDGNLYDLAEADPTDQADHSAHKSAKNSQPYDLGEVVEEQPRHDLVELSKPAKWCLACGCDLALVETSVCPWCEKKFDPVNPRTFSQEPPRELGNWWLQPPRLAGYVLIPLIAIGRMIINVASPSVGKGLMGGIGDSQAGIAAGAVLSALGSLFLIPWLIACVLLVLTGIREYFAAKIPVTMAMGAGFGILFTLGFHPAVNFIGLGAGGLAGFIYAWRAN